MASRTRTRTPPAFAPSLPIPTQHPIVTACFPRRGTITPSRRPLLTPPTLPPILTPTYANDSTPHAAIPQPTAQQPTAPTTTTPSSTSAQSPIVFGADVAPSPTQTDSPDEDDVFDTSTSMLSTLDDITEIINAVEESDLADFRLEHNGVSLEITREGGLGFTPDGELKEPPEPVLSPDLELQQQPPPGYRPDEMAMQPSPQVPDLPDAATAAMPEGSNDAQTAVAEPPAEEKDPDTIYDSDFVVTSNRVGFFFCGAKNKPPLVNIGDSVSFNQPVCIIEQLGQQYVYLSEAAGKVVKVFVEDGDPVMFGTQIMVIRPD